MAENNGEVYKKYNILDNFLVGEPTEENQGYVYYLEVDEIGLICTNDEKQYENAVLSGFIELTELEGEDDNGED